MTTAIGGWPGPDPWVPSDWNHRQATYLEFWAQFKEPATIRNTRAEAKPTCKEVKDADGAAPDGFYWLTLGTNSTYVVQCDMSTDGGGWTLMYANYAREASSGTWALSWDTTINIGKRFGNSPTKDGFLMPLKYWNTFNTVRATSDASGSILLNNFSLAAGTYALTFDDTGNGGMNYHRNRPLSTVDRDNDEWGNHCANYAKTFGWYGACCHMCMTTAIGGWPGPNAWWPSDWNHRQANYLIFWGR